MTSKMTTLPATGLTVQDVENILEEHDYQGFPIVEDASGNSLIGYIGRTELRYGLDRQRRETGLSQYAQCVFSPNSTAAASAMTPVPTVVTDMSVVYTEERRSTGEPPTIDFSRFTNHTPITVHPRLPLETTMELFKKMGPRVILVEHQGILIGLVTVKDCLKYQFKAEAQVHPKDDSALQRQQERLWEVIKSAAVMVKWRVAAWTGGRVLLGEPDVGNQSAPLPPPGLSESYASSHGGVLTGQRDSDPGTELEERYELGGTGSS